MTTHPIPDASLDQPLCIVGTVGSGKSYLAKSAVERLLAERRRVLIIDPTGVWYGLRSMADGSAGFPVVIFGGDHADVPVSPDAGEALGSLLADDQVSQAIVDVSEMTGGERTRFLTALLERLYAGKRVPRHLILDEADEMAPQDPLPETRRLQGIVDRIVRRGRVRGFRPMMITQRPAVIHKNVLSQIATLVALRLTSPQDRKAIEGWVKGSANLDEAKTVLASLPKLAVGEGWVWAPREGVLKRTHFPKITTLDTSATPDDDAAVDRPRTMAAVDVAAIRATLASGDTKSDGAAKASGKARRTDDIKAEIAAAEQRGYERGYETGARHAATEIRTTLSAIVVDIARFEDRLESPSFYCDESFGDRMPVGGGRTGGVSKQEHSSRAAALADARDRERAAANTTPVRPPKRDVASLPKTEAADNIGAERKPLASLASAHPAGMIEAQWAIAAGFKRSGGTWSTYKSRLRTAGRIEQRGSLWFVTDDGLAALGTTPVPMPTTNAELVDFWASRIPGAGPMLRCLADAYPRAIHREDLAEALGLAATGGTFGTYLSRLRSAGLIDEPERGSARATPALFPENRDG